MQVQLHSALAEFATPLAKRGQVPEREDGPPLGAAVGMCAVQDTWRRAAHGWRGGSGKWLFELRRTSIADHHVAGEHGHILGARHHAAMLWCQLPVLLRAHRL